jgi:hypothetical protein
VIFVVIRSPKFSMTDVSSISNKIKREYLGQGSAMNAAVPDEDKYASFRLGTNCVTPHDPPADNRRRIAL